ncbi:hypothetical protein HELRODRAFT_174210 [Helobdella robusta]|uniref:Uncharacterized protein n=1 Tax=Helobdella robusta TaxID=6412 RepID=T1F7S9_HELRO|nr:hypothetical protein HELRODRAFT_174210 [Helobdella robusta]ESO02792.1 hypothetical protein HELRODRAFT_174210 [Helobdella robusta]
MARSLVNNELLYFIENNWNLVENDSFINNIVKFYSHEDIVNAIKALKIEMNNLKIDKIDKLSLHGNMKIDKMLECISVVKFLKDNKYWHKCLVFVSSNLNKIPRVENLLKFSFKAIKRELMEILHKQQTDVTTMNTVNSTLTHSEQHLPGILWSEVVSSPIEDEQFTLVKRHSKQPRLNVSLEGVNNGEPSSVNVIENYAVVNSVKKTTTKVIGKKVIDNCKLMARQKFSQKI